MFVFEAINIFGSDSQIAPGSQSSVDIAEPAIKFVKEFHRGAATANNFEHISRLFGEDAHSMVLLESRFLICRIMQELVQQILEHGFGAEQEYVVIDLGQTVADG